jgi:hypothetical protein
MKTLKNLNPELLKDWDTEDLVEARDYALSLIDLKFPPLTATDAMWLERYETYAAELARRAN